VSLVKSDVSSVDPREILLGLRVEEVDGISEVGVKSTDLGETTSGEGGRPGHA